MAVPAADVLRRALPRPATESARDTDSPPVVAKGDGAWGHFTRRHAIALLFMRVHVPALRDLERGPWAILQAIAAHWQGGHCTSGLYLHCASAPLGAA